MSSSEYQITFQLDDQDRFAALSGDRNPMHMDPVAARRTQAGVPAVHGMHILLWAIDSLASRYPSAPRPTTIRADFKAFLSLGEKASLSEFTGSQSRRAFVTVNGLTVLAIELRFDKPVTAHHFPSVDVSNAIPAAPNEAAVLDMENIADQCGAVAFAAAPDLTQVIFPHASAWLGAVRVNGLLCCTRLVGMVCPGLHSIFNRLDLEFVEPVEPARLDYMVHGVEPRFRFVKLIVRGAGIAGTLTTSFRPPPVQQLRMAAASTLVMPNAFGQARALVVGGSRGLGELTAKLLAAGGAEVLITYAQGKLDADRVAAEINDWGGRCRVRHYDACADATTQLGDEFASISHCYYYATAPIFVPTASLFDLKRFDVFRKFYVDGFYDLCVSLRALGPSQLSMFYPSSVYIDERPPGMTEYAASKAAGEVLCGEINQRWKGVRVISHRLPRLPTDQTASLIVQKMSSAADVILPLIRRMHAEET